MSVNNTTPPSSSRRSSSSNNHNDRPLPWLSPPPITAVNHFLYPTTDPYHHPEAPRPPWLDPDTVVPPPGRVQTPPRTRRSAHDTGPPGVSGRRGGTTMVQQDKFDEVDEETLSPLSWNSELRASAQVLILFYHLLLGCIECTRCRLLRPMIP